MCIETFNTDEKNITLMGFSQGSILINAIALTYPEKVKNIISLSGAVDPDIINLSQNSFKNLSFFNLEIRWKTTIKKTIKIKLKYLNLREWYKCKVSV